MTHSLLKTSLLTALTVLFFNFTNASTIVEYDGANSEFVINDWTVDSPGFATTTAISVISGTNAILAINNTNSYKNITVEIHYKKVNNSYSNAIMADFTLIDNNNQTLVKTQNISDNTSASLNIITTNFSNAQGFLLKQFKFYNPNKNANIVYLKITGDLVGGSSAAINKQATEQFNIYVGSDVFSFNAKQTGTLTIYGATGAEITSYPVQKGKNTIADNTKGFFILLLKDENNKIIGKRKMIR